MASEVAKSSILWCYYIEGENIKDYKEKIKVALVSIGATIFAFFVFMGGAIMTVFASISLVIITVIATTILALFIVLVGLASDATPAAGRGLLLGILVFIILLTQGASIEISFLLSALAGIGLYFYYYWQETPKDEGDESEKEPLLIKPGG